MTSVDVKMEFDHSEYCINQMYKASEIYLRTKITPSVERLKVSKAKGEENLAVTVDKGEKIIDIFEGVQLKWEKFCSEKKQTYEGDTFEQKSIELSFPKEHMEKEERPMKEKKAKKLLKVRRNLGIRRSQKCEKSKKLLEMGRRGRQEEEKGPRERESPSVTNYDVDSTTWVDLRRAPLLSAMEVANLGHGPF
ncbi:hypothetical protein L1049_007252 [Liquidambar formosana]|uniref:AAA-type ATPase N-terminal domain-containing protein n=1 Tax=Liquidambar formosana TaxID=63359 RepID=A0AAP0WV64_LIQFO